MVLRARSMLSREVGAPARVSLASAGPASWCGGGVAALGPTLRARRAQAMPEQVQVGQRKEGEGLRRVLGETPIAHFAEAPEPLHDVEGMLHPGPESASGRG